MADVTGSPLRRAFLNRGGFLVTRIIHSTFLPATYSQRCRASLDLLEDRVDHPRLLPNR
jgi:hypothetical protein